MASIFLCSRSTLRASSQKKSLYDDEDDIEKEGKKMNKNNKINEIPVHVNQLWRDKGTLIDQVVYVYNIWKIKFIYIKIAYIHKRKEEE